jgi:hypothetical protein
MPRAVPAHVSTQTVRPELRLRTPYRGIETGKDTLRIRVQIAPRKQRPYEVVIDIDDLAVEVQGDAGFVLGAGTIDTLFVVERPPRYGFLTWFGVFARRRGRADQLLIETNESKVARFVERTIEDWLGLDTGPVRGELRLWD